MMKEFNFKEHGTVSDLTNVPEKYQGLYAEGTNEEGEASFTLTDTAKGIVADYVGVNKSLIAARKDKTNASNESASRRQSLKVFDDFVEELGLEIGDDGVAAALGSFVTDLQSKVKNGEEVQVNLSKIKADFQKRLDEGLAEKDVQITERDSALSSHLISDVATRALSKHKGSVDLLLPHVERHCKVFREEDGKYTVRVMDGQGDFRTNDSGGWMTVDEVVEEMKIQDGFGRAFDSETSHGTGARPGSMSRPTTRQTESKNLSSVDKIRIGLQKKQHSDGRGGVAV